MRPLVKASFGAALALGALLAGAIRADEPLHKLLAKGKAVEFAGKNVPAIDVCLMNGRQEFREYDGEKPAGTKKCAKEQMKGKTALITWDKQAPDKFKNKVAKYEIFFLSDQGKDQGPGRGDSDAKKLFAQGWDNSMFCIEVQGADAAPTQIVDMNDPIGWFKVLAFAVYGNGEWKATPTRLVAKSYEGSVGEADYEKSAIVLPENYAVK